MSNNTSKVADNSGTIVVVPDLNVPAERIYSFVERNRQNYFEDHSLDWALDEILTRGMAEITRSIKTTQKRAEDHAAGEVMKQFNMTPADAKKAFALLLQQQKTEQAKAATAK